MASIVTSFVPGRIRLRSKIFCDTEIVSAVSSILESTGIALSIETNCKTGSFLVHYKAESLPAEDVLKRRLKAFALSLPDFEKLRSKIAFYRPEYRESILETAQRLKDALPKIIAI